MEEWVLADPEDNRALGRDGDFGPAGLSLEDFRYWRDSLSGEWDNSAENEDGLDQQMQGNEDLYFQHYSIEAPEGKHVVRTGSAPADADAAIDSLTPADIQVRVRPARNRANHKKRADLVAKFARGVISEWRRNKDTFRLVAGNQAIRCVGVMRVLFDQRLWPPYPADASKMDKDEWDWKKRGKFPVILESRNPRYVRWQFSEQGELIAVVERYKTTVGKARIDLSHYDKVWGLLAGRYPNDEIWISDVWVGVQRAVFINDDPILPDDGIEVHGYREPPYVIVPFRELPFDEPGRRYRGMLSNAAGLYEIESQVLTMHVWQLAWNSWRTWVGHVADRGRKLTIAPGEFIDIDPQRGEYLQMLAGEPVPPELLQTAGIIGTYIQRNGIAQGPNTQEGTRSAQQVWAIQSIRQMKVEPGKQDLQRAVERCLKLASEIIQDRLPDEKLVLPVPGKDEQGEPIGEITISAKDLEGYEDSFNVTFGRRLDPAILEQAKAVMGLWTNEYMPYEVAVELGGMTDSPDEWADKKMLEAIDNLDFMKEIAGYEQLVQFYGEGDWRTQTFKQRMQAMQQPGQAGGAGGNGIVAPPRPAMQPTAMPAGPAPGAQGRPQPSRANGRMGGTPPPNAGGGGMPGNTAP